MQFERNCAITFPLFFLLFPYVSFLASKNFYWEEKFKQGLTNDPKSCGKRKRVATFAQILCKRKRMNEHLARRKALRRKIRKCECGFTDSIVEKEADSIYYGFL